MSLTASSSNASTLLPEPILTPDDSCYVMFPIKYHDLWDMYQRAVASFWQPGEIMLSEDLGDWDKKLNSGERHFLSMILAFFAASDGLVMENLAVRFMNDVQISEARAFYSFQVAIENIHSHTYSILIDTYIRDKTERDTLFSAMSTMPCIKKKADWTKRWMHDDAPFAARLVAFAAVEGIFFSGAFCSIFWMKNRGLMPGLTFSNELISRDEALHCEFAVMLYGHLNNKLTHDEVHAIIREAVEIEHEFICHSLPCKLVGINADSMKEYICFVANRLALQFGCNKVYPGATNPFPWMEMISLGKKTNFFEHTVSDYALSAGVGKENAFSALSEEAF